MKLRPNGLQISMLLAFEIFGSARNHGKMFLKLYQTSFGGIVHSTAIIDQSNMLKPYMEVLILSVLHVPPEKDPTENRIIAGKL